MDVTQGLVGSSSPERLGDVLTAASSLSRKASARRPRRQPEIVTSAVEKAKTNFSGGMLASSVASEFSSSVYSIR